MTHDSLPSAALVVGLLLGGTATAAPDPEPTSEPAPGEDADEFRRYRTPFSVLAERTIGTASQPVEFNWRRTRGQFALTGDQLLELNNFNSMRAGGLFRVPAGGLLCEAGLSYAWVWDTPSSELLALTPYRQPGRAPRVELDLQVGIPLAEGAVTTRPRWLPAAQLVLNGYVGLRYLFYPSSFDGMRAGEVVAAAFSPRFTRTERENLQERRLDAMRLDSARYGLQVGLGNDVYFRQGVFMSPRAMLGLPILAPATRTQLRLSGSLTLAVGAAW